MTVNPDFTTTNALPCTAEIAQAVASILSARAQVAEMNRAWEAVTVMTRNLWGEREGKDLMWYRPFAPPQPTPPEVLAGVLTRGEQAQQWLDAHSGEQVNQALDAAWERLLRLVPPAPDDEERLEELGRIVEGWQAAVRVLRDAWWADRAWAEQEGVPAPPSYPPGSLLPDTVNMVELEQLRIYMYIEWLALPPLKRSRQRDARGDLVGKWLRQKERLAAEETYVRAQLEAAYAWRAAKLPVASAELAELAPQTEARLAAAWAQRDAWRHAVGAPLGEAAGGDEHGC
jgi:hypothetical protein